MYWFIHVYVCVYTHAPIQPYVYMHKYVLYMQICIHTCIHACIYTMPLHVHHASSATAAIQNFHPPSQSTPFPKPATLLFPLFFSAGRISPFHHAIEKWLPLPSPSSSLQDTPYLFTMSLKNCLPPLLPLRSAVCRSH